MMVCGGGVLYDGGGVLVVRCQVCVMMVCLWGVLVVGFEVCALGLAWFGWAGV